jgi:cbb3-type cytochrome oxidase subunit 3
MTRLADLISGMSPTQTTELALVLFLAVFVTVVIRHGGKRRATEHAACAQLPLSDDAGDRR